MDAEALLAVAEWRLALGVRQSVRVERIHRRQVTSERGCPGCGLVGVAYDEECACIYHTRALLAEDIVHELLHVAHPAWTEEQVALATQALLSQDEKRMAPEAGDACSDSESALNRAGPVSPQTAAPCRRAADQSDHCF